MGHICSDYFSFLSIGLGPKRFFPPLDSFVARVHAKTRAQYSAASGPHGGETGVSPVHRAHCPDEKRDLHRRARHERRPVNAALVLIIRLKHMFERKRELRRAMRIDMRNPFYRFVNARQMSHWHPPQREIGAFEFLEPLFPMAQI